MISFYNKVVQADLQLVNEAFSQWEIFKDKKILITGANGHIAMYLSFAFIFQIKYRRLNCKLVLLSRNEAKLKSLYSDFEKEGIADLMISSVEDINEIDADYIFHFAGNASPNAIVNDPVGIMNANILGTFKIANIVSQNKTGRIIFSSSREVYGETIGIDYIGEHDFGKIDTLNFRSCYPESKRASETILESYRLQYGLDYSIVRIAHAYGPGMNTENDGRVMQDLIGSAIDNRDIVLKSNGSAVRAFCYIADVISGILMVASDGVSGEAYNISNENEEISILELANLICQINGVISIVYAEHPDNRAYCGYKRIGLDTSKLEKLGWTPRINLKTGISNILKSC